MTGDSRVFVLGTGAVGAFLGGVLALGGWEAVLIGRRRVVGPIGEAGLTIAFGGAGPARQAAPAVAESLADALARCGTPDVIILAAKSFATAEAAREIAAEPALQGERAPFVLTVQNGVGNEETLAERLGAERILSGALTLAVSMPGPGRVAAHQGKGGLALAPFPHAGNHAADRILAALAAGFRAGGISTAVYPGHATVKWSKLLLNILANATCAILDMPPSQALHDRGVFLVERWAYQEAVAVMKAAAVPVVDLPGYPVRLLTKVMLWFPCALAHRLLYPRIAGGRGDKLPSFLVDLRNGRRESEVVFLNGAVAGQARRYGLQAPVNEVLTATLTGIASGAIPWSRFRHRPDRLVDAVRAARLAAVSARR